MGSFTRRSGRQTRQVFINELQRQSTRGRRNPPGTDTAGCLDFLPLQKASQDRKTVREHHRTQLSLREKKTMLDIE